MNRMMNRTLLFVALSGVFAAPLMAAGHSLSGVYVEARTAEVFVGGCLMSSEAETTGKQAVLAWKVNHGSLNGVQLDGLSVVAAVVGDKNLGIHEIGGAKPISRSALFVDSRARTEQRAALITMVKALSTVTGTIVSVTPAPIEFNDKGMEISVAAPQIRLAVDKHAEHNPGCGAEQWFHPLAQLESSTIGLAKEHAFIGSNLGSKWSDPDKVSAFFGNFSY
jgi:hypothetical protein